VVSFGRTLHTSMSVGGISVGGISERSVALRLFKVYNNLITFSSNKLSSV
jgi:hypothetical protein